jgi:hypothetical protein
MEPSTIPVDTVRAQVYAARRGRESRLGGRVVAPRSRDPRLVEYGDG